MVRLDPASALVTAGLHPQVGAGRLDEAHVGDAVVAGDLERAHPLLGGVGRERAAEHRRVVAHDHALGAGDHPDPDDHPAAEGVVGLVGGQRADLEERAVGVEDVGDPLTDRQLSPGAQAGHALGPATPFGLVEQRLDLGQLLQHVGPVPHELRIAGVEGRPQGRGEERLGHGPRPYAGNLRSCKLSSIDGAGSGPGRPSSR